MSPSPTEAAVEYLLRKWKRAHPKGHTEKGMKWYPVDEENQDCCKSIRQPSRAYPWSLMTHCRSLTHVANLYGVDETEVRNCLSKKNLICLLGINQHVDTYIEGRLKTP
jgi:hypothetical protein